MPEIEHQTECEQMLFDAIAALRALNSAVWQDHSQWAVAVPETAMAFEAIAAYDSWSRSGLQRMTNESARLHLAWLMWCFDQGYVKAEDRAPLTNWLLEDPSTLHPDDAALRPHLLAMADEVLIAMKATR